MITIMLTSIIIRGSLGLRPVLVSTHNMGHLTQYLLGCCVREC